MGFGKKHGTVYQTVRLTTLILQAANRHQKTGAVFLDIAKAFDRIWHEGLVLKMLHNKLPVYQASLTKSFLTDREFQVTVDGTTSTTRPMTAGVPQGSCLSPLLFNIYMADIPKSRHTNLLAYADDTAITASAKIHKHIATKLQAHLTTLATWMDKWRLQVNPAKTQVVLFNNGRKQPPRDVLHWKGSRLQWSKTAKYLEVMYDSNLNWRAHIQKTRRNAQIQLHTLYPLIGRNSRLNIKNKLNIYKLYIRPIITYAAPAWATVSPTNLRDLQSMENRILRTILQAPWFIRNTTLRRDSELMPLTEFMKNLAITHFGKSEVATNPAITESHVQANPEDRLKYPKDSIMQQ